MSFSSKARSLVSHVRAWLAEGQVLAHAGFGMTPREREGVMLIVALFVLGLAVQWVRWLLG